MAAVLKYSHCFETVELTVGEDFAHQRILLQLYLFLYRSG